jgi:hypothetical protein
LVWIEFFDFYIYANAAVLVFPNCFSFGGQYQFGFTLLGHVFDSISFSALVQQYLAGDKVGRKTTLVIALLTMGISTVSIGFT